MKKSRAFDVGMTLLVVVIALAVALYFARKKAAECEAELQRLRPPVIQQAETPAEEKPAVVPDAPKEEPKVKPRIVKTKPKQRPISQSDTFASGDGVLIKEPK